MGNRSSKNVKKDIKIIVLLGPSGAGKSTFINTAMGRSVAKVGRDLTCCTASVQRISCPMPEENKVEVLLVDTPAFDHDTLSLPKIEDMIRSQLKAMTKRKIKVTGIIYFHPITVNRMTEVPKEHMGVFERLVGECPARKVLLVTTRWKDLGLAETAGYNREDQLRRRYWKDMLDGGSAIKRFEDTKASAWHLIQTVLDS